MWLVIMQDETGRVKLWEVTRGAVLEDFGIVSRPTPCSNLLL